MAQRRMFSMKIVDSDAFLEMPVTAQNLYFHLSMRADDDGFNDSPKKVMRVIGAKEDDLKILLAKRFIIGFESGIVVIKHWKIHNYIAPDRYHPTHYQEELSALEIKDNGSYTDCIQDVLQDDYSGKVRLGKERIGKVSIVKDNIEQPLSTKKTYIQDKFIKPSLQEIIDYIKENNYTVNPNYFYNYYEARGWEYKNKQKMKSWKGAIGQWESNNKKREEEKTEQEKSPVYYIKLMSEYRDPDTTEARKDELAALMKPSNLDQLAHEGYNVEKYRSR